MLPDDLARTLTSLPDWSELLLPSTSIVELLIRGSAMYVIILGFLRIAQKRQSSGLSVADILVVVLLADAAAPALNGQAVSIGDGAILVGIIIAWSHALNWLAYRYAAIDKLIHPSPVQLVKDGEILWRAMRRELVSEKELRTQLRKEGYDCVEKHLDVFMEADGSISVIDNKDEK